MTPAMDPQGWDERARWRALPAPARRILTRLLRHGEASRTALAAELELSPASLTRHVSPLLDLGVVREGPTRAQDAKGRPAIPLVAVADWGLLIGVSISHHDVVAVATDLRAEPLALARGHLADTDVETVVALIADLVADLGSGLGERIWLGLGVCLGGNVADGRSVRRAPFLGWDDEPLAERLEQACGLPVLLGNDIAALARAETWFGLGLSASRFFVLTVGVGTGFALVVDRQVVTDADHGYGLITDEMRPHWPDFRHPERLTGGAAREAALQVGRLIGTAAAFTLPEGVVVSGEGAVALVGHEGAITEGIRQVRHPLASDLAVHLRTTDVSFWARGAATQVLQGRPL